MPDDLVDDLGFLSPVTVYRFSIDPEDEQLFATVQWRLGHLTDAGFQVGRKAAHCDRP